MPKNILKLFVNNPGNSRDSREMKIFNSRIPGNKKVGKLANPSPLLHCSLYNCMTRQLHEPCASKHICKHIIANYTYKVHTHSPGFGYIAHSRQFCATHFTYTVARVELLQVQRAISNPLLFLPLMSA